MGRLCVSRAESCVGKRVHWRQAPLKRRCSREAQSLCGSKAKKQFCERGIGNDGGLRSALAARVPNEVGMPSPHGVLHWRWSDEEQKKWQRSRGGSAGGRRSVLERWTGMVAASTSTILPTHRLCRSRDLRRAGRGRAQLAEDSI
jgi:hypothetical protein